MSLHCANRNNAVAFARRLVGTVRGLSLGQLESRDSFIPL